MVLLIIFLVILYFLYTSIKLKFPKCPVCGTELKFYTPSCPNCGYDSQPIRTHQLTFPVVDNGVYYRVSSDRFARLVFKAEGNTYNFVVYISKVTPDDIVFLKLVSKSFVGSRVWFDIDCYVNGIKTGSFSKNLKNHNAEWVAVERLVNHDFTQY